ncbi:ExbD/TolR family protein [Methylophaga pinxianii]|uniref:ExbD/TolR family protein n=1 Tax=Methylophaga pinxianii TaxID=2881052 RepID=UPI001CF54D45|nr:biopolymer transporter ExbD [Methylophaga pinxianii]MCB2426320.1 biopolymer transporter ExbD [Methylophaga pinxianii]UPH46674.1 biopolymer transporter ExbD [Methylophaga pinxianii]
MKLMRQHSEEPDVNLTPMIDVVFLLLLFFMVSTSFIRESSLKVDLPEATGQALAEQEAPIDIIIRANGEVLVNDTPIAVATRDALRDLLKTTAGENADPHIIISADANAEYQQIVTAMDAAQLLGFTRLTLATRQKSVETP